MIDDILNPESTQKKPFNIGQSDGIIRTNMYFIESMQGYFSFEVKINDSNPAHVDKANVTVSSIIL